MAKDPAFLFYSSDFLVGTLTMSDEQVGKYIRLLCLQHQKSILSEKDMLNICKSYDKDIYDKFQKIETGYVNERLLQETIKRSKYSESRRNNRTQKNICKSYDEHMENESENINKDISSSLLLSSSLPKFEFTFDELKTEFTNSDQWIETLMRGNTKLKTTDQVKELMFEFCVVLSLSDQYPIILKEAKNRFGGWVKKRLNGKEETTQKQSEYEKSIPRL